MGARAGTDRRTLRAVAPGLALACALAAAAGGAPPRTSVVLVTLDTTRADALGCYGASRKTPALDALAARGVRYAAALTASPLTLPAHASLLTGLDPPEHGVTDNGTAVLEADVPTLASVLSARGYATAAFVGSRILDRRFGMARGFATYDDRMAAEITGEYGYPERSALAVTASALAWLKTRPAGRPFFLWAHYYDPHAPYDAPGATPAEKYAGEVAAVDRELGRLFAALPPGSLVAAVGDHGESLGEHGERGHGIFLYDATLRVPLLIAGPGVPAGRAVDEVVATRRLAPTLLRLLGETGLKGTALPGVGAAPPPEPVFSETRLPASAFGWSPLRALSEARWRFIEAPRSELYDVVADPGQVQELSTRQSADFARMRKQLAGYVDRLKPRTARAPAPEAAEAVRSLGYLSGASGGRPGSIDPKDGIRLLEELDQAKAAMRAGRFAEALPRMKDLCARSPGNVPFLTQLARAQMESGDLKGAVVTFATARDANPRSEFAHLHLAGAFRRSGQREDARKSYESALAQNPRAAEAWLALAEMAKEGGRPDEEYDVLRRAVEAGTASGSLLTRLAQIEIARGAKDAADRHLEEATSLLPQWPMGWLIWAALAETQQKDTEAIARYERASAADPKNPTPLLQLGRLRLKHGDTVKARVDLERVAALAPASAVGREAQRLLATLKP